MQSYDLDTLENVYILLSPNFVLIFGLNPIYVYEFLCW